MADPDPDAARRQAITRISQSIMMLTYLMDDPSAEPIKEPLAEIHESLTKARFMLVKHCDPDNILDELSQL